MEFQPEQLSIGKAPSTLPSIYIVGIQQEVVFSLSTPDSGGSEVKASARNVGDLGSDPWVGKIPWRKKWQPTLVFLPGESHGRRSLVGYSPGVTKSQTRLSDFTFTFTPDSE